MAETDWETIEVPTGSYVGWGSAAGQHVTGKITELAMAGGEDFNGNPCPQLGIELSEKAASFNKGGERTDFEAGDYVKLTVGQANLKDKVTRANPPLAVGQEVKISLEGTETTSSGNTVKVFKLARNPATVNKFESVSAGNGRADEPPF